MVLEPKTSREYISWLYRNPAGFVLNLHTSGKDQSILHTASCKSLYPPDESVDHLTYPKACSNSRDDLFDWGERAGHTVTGCQFCDP